MPQSLNLADVSFDAHILEDVDRQVYYFRLLQLHVSYFAIFSCQNQLYVTFSNEYTQYYIYSSLSYTVYIHLSNIISFFYKLNRRIKPNTIDQRPMDTETTKDLDIHESGSTQHNLQTNQLTNQNKQEANQTLSPGQTKGQIESQASKYQQLAGDKNETPITEKPIQNSQPSQSSIPKFIKTDQLISIDQPSGGTQQSNNRCSQIRNTNYVVEKIIGTVLENTNRNLDIIQKAGQLAILQTLEIVVGDPYMGIFNGQERLPQHNQNDIVLDKQPITTAFIDGGVGHVRLRELNLKKNLQNTQDKKNGLTSIKNKLKKFKLINSFNFKLNKLREQGKTDKSKQSSNVTSMGTVPSNFTKRNNQICKSHLDLNNELILLEQQTNTLNKLDSEDHFINYLRFAKVQYNSNIGDKYDDKHNWKGFDFNNQHKSMMANNSKMSPKSNSLGNKIDKKLLSSKNIPESKKLLQKSSAGVVKEQAKQNKSYEHKMFQGLKRKKLNSYSNYIEIHDTSIIQNNIYSYNVSQAKEIKILSKKQINNSPGKNGSNSNQAKQLLFRKQDGSAKETEVERRQHRSKVKQKQGDKMDQLIRKYKKREDQQKSNKQTKLPPIKNSGKKSQNKENLQIGFHEQISIWYKDRRKVKQFDNQFTEFINRNNSTFEPDISNNYSKISYAKIKPLKLTSDQQQLISNRKCLYLSESLPAQKETRTSHKNIKSQSTHQAKQVYKKQKHKHGI